MTPQPYVFGSGIAGKNESSKGRHVDETGWRRNNLLGSKSPERVRSAVAVEQAGRRNIRGDHPVRLHNADVSATVVDIFFLHTRVFTTGLLLILVVECCTCYTVGTIVIVGV